MMLPPLVVYSHLRWDFVFQRPQHLISRIARQTPVYFVEEPVRGDGEPRWEKIDTGGNVTVLRPVTPIERGGFCQDQEACLCKLVASMVKELGVEDHVAWVYTPMAYPIAKAGKPGMIVHDCMDQLSAFLGAPPELLQMEKDLMRDAAVVFTGGRSLFRDKQALH